MINNWLGGSEGMFAGIHAVNTFHHSQFQAATVKTTGSQNTWAFIRSQYKPALTYIAYFSSQMYKTRNIQRNLASVIDLSTLFHLPSITFKKNLFFGLYFYYFLKYSFISPCSFLDNDIIKYILNATFLCNSFTAVWYFIVWTCHSFIPISLLMDMCVISSLLLIQIFLQWITLSMCIFLPEYLWERFLQQDIIEQR